MRQKTGDRVPAIRPWKRFNGNCYWKSLRFNSPALDRENLIDGAMLKQQAATMAAQDRHYHQSGELLTSARAADIVALNKLLCSTAVMYDLKLKSPPEEFEYEMSRFPSFEELVPIGYVESKFAETASE